MKVKLIKWDNAPTLGFRRIYKNTQNPFLYIRNSMKSIKFDFKVNNYVYYYNDEISLPKFSEKIELWSLLTIERGR
jgi:hypothetical protein